MTTKKTIVCLTILTTILTGCFMGAGTHGSIKSYTFSCNKDTLQSAIMIVIKNNPNISRDTSLDYLGSSPMLDNNTYDSTGYHNYPAGDNYYNDIKHYVTIKIASGQEINEYTFRYYGPDEDWKKRNTSGIFICYAHDRNGNGGSEGNGGINWRTGTLKNQLTDLFEKELVQKVDSILKSTHTETE